MEGDDCMRAFSETKYLTPNSEEYVVTLQSRDAKLKIEVSEPVKYIRRDNSSEIFRPLVLEDTEKERV